MTKHVVEGIHESYVVGRRVRVLADHLARLMPENADVLDVGAGDGRLARRILDHRPDLTVRGVDVLVRDQARIPVEEFDGTRLPFEDASVDVVMLVDVLHHTEDAMQLLRECMRVARRALLIKDHTEKGLLAHTTLRLMDVVGNARHGVALPYNYWTEARWRAAFRELDLDVAEWRTALGLYPGPADWIFGRSLHFIARLSVPGRAAP